MSGRCATPTSEGRLRAVAAVRRGLLAIGVALGLTGPAAAATIDIQTSEIDGERVSFITIDGEIEFGDEARFVDLAIGLPDGMVLLNSPGGNVNAGIEIGKAIRLKGFKTAAIDAYSCASACALAWLGGTMRFMAIDAAVGFHAVYLADDPMRKADSVGNALVGAYLNQLGLTQQAIAYITGAQPQEMRWLSFADARAVGIEVVALDPPEESNEPVDPGLPDAGRGDWASYGEWIQIFSRQSFAEAADLATAFRRDFPGTFVFRYDNGWYVGAIGPYPFGKARPERDRLVRAHRIPADSLVNRGDRFTDLVWGASPERQSVSALPSNEAMALDAAEEFFSATSQPRGEALAYLEGSIPRRWTTTAIGPPSPMSCLRKIRFFSAGRSGATPSGPGASVGLPPGRNLRCRSGWSTGGTTARHGRPRRRGRRDSPSPSRAAAAR